MLAGRLVPLIESQWEDITARVVEQVRRDPEMAHLRALLESELREWGENLLHNLGHWLAARNEVELGRHYEHIGRLRFEENIPLHELVRGLCIIRETMLDFVEEHITAKNTMALYEEEVLDRRIGRFFDLLTIHLVHGYERALRHAILV
jgi:hypothetical protein